MLTRNPLCNPTSRCVRSTTLPSLKFESVELVELVELTLLKLLINDLANVWIINFIVCIHYIHHFPACRPQLHYYDDGCFHDDL